MRGPVTAGVALGDVARRRRGHSLWMPKLGGDGVTLASSRRLRVVPGSDSGTPHAKAAWIEVATLTEDVSMISLWHVAATNSAAANSSALLDIGAGDAQDVVVPNLAVGYRLINDSYDHIPVFIPAGSSVWMRVQSALQSWPISLEVAFWAYPYGKRPPSRLVSIGAQLAASRGTILTLPAAVNTKGAWTELGFAPQPLQALIVGEQAGSDTTLTGASTGLIDIGMGAAGSEVVIARDIPVLYGANETTTAMLSRTHPVSVPAGARLAGRFATSNITTNAMDVALVGVPV